MYSLDHDILIWISFGVKLLTSQKQYTVTVVNGLFVFYAKNIARGHNAHDQKIQSISISAITGV